MNKIAFGVTISGIALVGLSAVLFPEIAILPRVEAEVSAAANNAKVLQDNYNAIQRIANANRNSNPTIKKIFEDMDNQAKTFRAAVDAKVVAKDPGGAELLKKDAALTASIAELTKAIQEKQKERATLNQERSKIVGKNLMNPEFQALSKSNADAMRGLQDQLAQQVSQVSEEGKQLAAERSRLSQVK